MYANPSRYLIRPNRNYPAIPIPDNVAPHHIHTVGPNQCSSALVQHIAAPISTVWSFVRRFDKPQAYKPFIRSCHLIVGDGNIGSLREVNVTSGLPAKRSTERLEILDDERHVMSFRIVGGDHRLGNYKSVTSLHPDVNNGTVVVESYVVDVPPNSTKDHTFVIVDFIVGINLRSLARRSEKLFQQ